MTDGELTDPIIFSCVVNKSHSAAAAQVAEYLLANAPIVADRSPRLEECLKKYYTKNPDGSSSFQVNGEQARKESTASHEMPT